MKINAGQVFTIKIFFFGFHSCYIAIAGKSDIEIFYPAVIREEIAGTGRAVNGIADIVIFFEAKHAFLFFKLFKRSDFTEGVIKIKILDTGPFPQRQECNAGVFCGRYNG